MPLTRDAIKSAFRLALNKSRSRAEARRLTKLRSKYFAGTLTPLEAMIGWLDITLDAKSDPKHPGLKVVA